MEVLGPVCECLKCIWSPLSRDVGYVKDLNDNFKKLNKETKDLCNRREDITREICRDLRLKIPSKVCKAWLEEVEQIENQMIVIEAEINANKRCFNACCFPDISSRLKLGKIIVTMINDATRLKKASVFKDGVVLVDAPVEIVERVSVSTTNGQTSTDRLVQNILKCITDENIRRIGLWGMGGVGKTTVMKILNNLPEISQTFEVVIWVTVSKDWSVRKVQNEIVQRLHINQVDNESDDRVARRIFQKLENMKCLLLLDDVWNQMDLEEVGIPMPNKEIGCKVVITSRSLDICKKMDTDVEIKVEVLSKEEAWSLFHEKVGAVVDLPTIESIARYVVEECDGLPLAVLVIGGSLRKVKDVHEWRYALDQLRSASFEIDDMEELVFKRLKLSYDRLKNDNVKNCFLYCALYPEDSTIPMAELVEHWRAEGFTDAPQRQSLYKAYDKAHTILNSLIDNSLLERIGDGHVKMHDVIRDLALRITSPNGGGPRLLVRAGVGAKESENMGEWAEAERISLMDNQLSSLPASPRCNSLYTLLLQRNIRLKKIPELFFQHMCSLRVLNLWNTSLQVLPSSVSNLVNLRGLYIMRSKFGEIETLPSEIGALKRLEVLYLGGIASLPLEVRELTSLRSLRVAFSGKGQAMKTMCSCGVLSGLFLLEDLRVSFRRGYLWRLWCEMVDIGVAEEVGSLKYLTTLMFKFPTTECFEHFVKKRHMTECPELRRFDLSVSNGGVSSWERTRIIPPQFGEERMAKDISWCSGQTISSGIMQVLAQACNFKLVGHKMVEKLSDFGIENMNTLQTCKLEDCLAIETIVDGNGSMITNSVLPNLQKFYLWNLPNLKSICDHPSPPPPQIFTALTYLEICSCPKLKCVFTLTMIQHMSNLEELLVKDCKEIKEIVGMREVEKDAALLFPRLKRLYLQELDKLVRIWKGVSQPWPSVETVTVWSCPNLKTLNLKVIGDNSPSALRMIVGEREWWEALEWELDDDHVKHQLEGLFVHRRVCSLLRPFR